MSPDFQCLCAKSQHISNVWNFKRKKLCISISDLQKVWQNKHGGGLNQYNVSKNEWVLRLALKYPRMGVSVNIPRLFSDTQNQHNARQRLISTTHIVYWNWYDICMNTDLISLLHSTPYEFPTHGTFSEAILIGGGTTGILGCKYEF